MRGHQGKSIMVIMAFILSLLFCSFSGGAYAAELKPLPEITLVTWTKTQFPVQYEQAFMIAEAWKKLGIKVRVEPLSYPNPLVERAFKTRDFDLFIIHFTPQLERLDPDFYTYNTFHSSNAAPGGWNFSGFASKEFDKLAEAQRSEYNLEKRKKLVDQCQEILYKENPWLILVNNDELQAYNKVDFKDPVIPPGGFWDSTPFFTIKPTGSRKVIRLTVPWTDLKTINPLLSTDVNQVRILYLIYDTLMRIGPDAKPQPWAAKEVKPVDEKTIEVTLRNDLLFHDKKPVTADDVKFTFDLMIKHKAPYFKTSLDPVDSVEVLDKYRVRFRLKKPYAPFISQTLAMNPILPKHIWEKIEKPNEYRNVPPVGSGPFKFDHWRESQEIKLSRFAEHFRPTQVEGTLIIFYGTREAGFTALLKKDVDVDDYLLAHQMDELKGAKDIQTVRAPSHSADSLIFNLRRKPFDDPKLRFALAHAIPKQQMLGDLYNTYGNVGASVIAPANKYWNNEQIKPYPFDVEKSRELLKQAGYSWDKEGRLCLPE
jgi:peptide/nickel transport system substrate-binding protein